VTAGPRPARADYIDPMTGCDVLVTGARGFVGRNVLARALDAGLDARAADGDLRDAAVVDEQISAARPGAVVHLAATRRGGDPWQVLGDDLAMAAAILAAVGRHVPGAAVLVAGSAAQYGMGAPRPLVEDDPTVPLTAYAAVKCVLERAVTAAPLQGSARVIFVRSFNHIGPGQGTDAPAAQWARQASEAEAAGGGTIRTGNLDVVRDFLDVRDVADAYLALARSPAQGVVNVCSGVGVALRDVLDLITGAASVAVGVEQDPALTRSVDPPHIVGDPARLRELTGWTPDIPLEQSVADLLGASAVVS
jgi:GDP-4-dehydro-6-deoxy-D-mannose reductase